MSWLGLDRLFGFRRVEKSAAAKPQRPVYSNKPVQVAKAAKPTAQKPLSLTQILGPHEATKVRATANLLSDRNKPLSDGEIAALLDAPTEEFTMPTTDPPKQDRSISDTQEMQALSALTDPEIKKPDLGVKAGEELVRDSSGRTHRVGSHKQVIDKTPADTSGGAAAIIRRYQQLKKENREREK